MLLQVLVPLLFAALSPSIALHHFGYSAASPAQIRFAYENKFDNTGPGAKEPEYAHKVLNDLEEALVAFLDDPDTQLPPKEKARAIANLYRNEKHSNFKVVKDLNLKPQVLPIILTSYSKAGDVRAPSPPEVAKKQSEWFYENGKTLAHILHSPKFRGFNYQYKPNPDVEFSVDLHDKETGDMKTAHELRDGSGTVHGYYTSVDRSGRTHLVQYEANPLNGLRSEIRRVL